MKNTGGGEGGYVCTTSNLRENTEIIFVRETQL